MLILNITLHSDLTFQDQIVGQLRARILSGALKADEPLPSIRALAKQLKVGVNTVQKAFEILLTKKLIYARVGRGCFVAPLEGDDRVEIAGNRFRENLQRIWTEGLREGLHIKDMRRIIDEIADGEEDV